MKAPWLPNYKVEKSKMYTFDTLISSFHCTQHSFCMTSDCENVLIISEGFGSTRSILVCKLILFYFIILSVKWNTQFIVPAQKFFSHHHSFVSCFLCYKGCRETANKYYSEYRRLDLESFNIQNFSSLVSQNFHKVFSDVQDFILTKI